MNKLITHRSTFAYPRKFIEKCIFRLLNTVFENKSKVTTVLKKELRIVLAYLGNMSYISKTKLAKTVKK